ncbi:hypothetical protein LTR17_004997 [Elasticomyces elasticus]|nr:hypothetical protein LTR17_004997 [Elasticomyces elasticus]
MSCTAILCLAFALCTIAVAHTVPTARTLNGTYDGTSVPSLSQDIFLGIPFAQQRRFEQAIPLDVTWSGSRNATEPGLTCAGYGTNPRENWPIGENCLNLDVVRPQGAYEGLDLPVLLWMYGGGFRQGSNRDPEFNTSYMVQTSMQTGHPLIVVSINYRLSAFGFIASQEAAGNGALNIGLQDQRQALRWIQENIRGFGGDRSRVTIWGESAGAQCVALQVMAYGGDTQNLFRGGIMASGQFFGFGQRSLAQAQIIYDNVTNHTGCNQAIDTFQCLKDLPFGQLNETVYDQNQGQNFGPVFDGDLFRTYPFVAFQQGRLPPINLITGCNSDEGMSLGGQTAANTSLELELYLEAGLGINKTLAQQLLDLYPLDAPSPPYSVPNDYPWQEATLKIGLVCGNQTRRSYGIFGSHLSTPGLGPGFAQHGAELSWEFRLPYVSSTPYPPLPNITAMQNVSYAMQATWASFASTGSPNHHGLGWIPHWPAYSNGSKNFVFNGTLNDTLNLHIEDDDFRKEGIKWMNERWPLLDG